MEEREAAFVKEVEGVYEERVTFCGSVSSSLQEGREWSN
jgi:putative transposon-encoded protein